MGITPDLAGFRDAQRKLREFFGEVVTFLAPATPTYPPGTQIDPDKGQPFDPTIKPTAVDQPTVDVTCDVVLRTEAMTKVDWTAMGMAAEAHVMLIADLDDRQDDAVAFTVRERTYEVVGATVDGIGGLQRWLVWGRRK